MNSSIFRFWSSEFSQMIGVDKFDKEHSYNIRHNYGKEGSRINYSPYSCMKIITTAVGPQDACGCPFKLWDVGRLRTKLASYGISPIHVQEITAFSSKGHYQLACNRTFEVTHDSKLEEGINHPNQYFELSQVVMGARQPKSKDNNQPTSQHAAYNNRKQNQATQQQALRRKIDQRSNLNNTDMDEELWKLSQAEEDLLNGKSILATQNSVAGTSHVKDSDWGDDDGLDFSEANLTLHSF